jgi:ribosomal protein S18 acetylase RimI-like enzyme
MNPTILYRTMMRAEIPAVMRLCRAANWNQLEEDWEQFFAHEEQSCLLAERSGAIVGTVATIAYENRFGWIGMMLVDPACRRQGIGTRLMERAIETLAGVESIRLDATPVGREVYLQLGFVDEYGLQRMRIAADRPNSAMTARPMRMADLQSLLETDEEIFGAPRPRLFQWLFHQRPEYAWVVAEADRILGFCLGRSGHDFEHLGPVIAPDAEIAAQLVAACLQAQCGKAVGIDVMQGGSAWIARLESMGFAQQRPFIRMRRGENRFPGVPEKQYGILGPEFG